MSESLSERIQYSFGINSNEISLYESSEVGIMGARATAQGNVIRFAPGEYNPDTTEGLKILGHELNHVCEQAESNVRANVEGTNIHFDPAHEATSDRMGEAFASGNLSGATPISIASAYGAAVQGLFRLPWNRSDPPAPTDMRPNYIFYDETMHGSGPGAGREIAYAHAESLRSHLGEDTEIRLRTMHNRVDENGVAYGDFATMWQEMGNDVNNVTMIGHGNVNNFRPHCIRNYDDEGVFTGYNWGASPDFHSNDIAQLINEERAIQNVLMLSCLSGQGNSNLASTMANAGIAENVIAANEHTWMGHVLNL